MTNLLVMIDSSKNLLMACKPLLGIIRPSVLSLLIEVEKEMAGSSVLCENMNFLPEKYFEKYSKLKGYELNQLETTQQQRDWMIKSNSTLDQSLIVLKQSIDRFYTKDSIDIFFKLQESKIRTYSLF